ncbi:protein TolQ [Bermanella marisrubri]|uniref:Tol-Pal system protein TolQ n=1 Tax=Bermanella marisrubri TaxID=207949 RepID=Q1N0T5_9GAMM|nr:protein TolQ [Bermanella marisrubri]EAT11748.1 Biopolymer transport protein [Oceanobacter sp. RED65] [Bermanella marisrubri]
MNESMSIWSLIANASWVVQGVMLVLVAAVFISWTIIIQRHRLLTAVKDGYEDFEDRFWSGMDLSQLYKEINQEPPAFGVENIFAAGFREFSRLRQQGGDPEAIIQGTQRAMRVATTKEAELLENHLPFLATVGSTSPYVGLFGTVWGIMNSFRGLANVQQATLAVVAPGIAEALIATAIGLFAAIPAVIFYNRFTTKVDQITSHYETFAEEFISILHRQVYKKNKTQAVAE